MLVVGFDLDMTLLDSRAGVVATYAALSAETGVPIDGVAAAGRIGPPLAEEIARWFPADQVVATTERYRELYRTVAIPMAEPMPHALEAVRAVRRQGGRVVVVTSKSDPLARLCVEALGLEVDAVVGWLFGDAKAAGLREHGVTVYVGDHVGDVAGALAGGAVPVAVATGPCSAAELADAGASTVLADLGALPAWLDAHLLPERLAALNASLSQLGSVLVAFSGGTDSAFLLAAAARVLGPSRVAAATAVSPSLPPGELAAAREFAAALGVRHATPPTDELDREGYRANAGDRCFFCKAELLDVLGPIASRLGLAAVATGTNADDAVAGFRPGIRAAAERGAATPLLAAGLTKAQIRAASRAWGLPTWDKPAAACLSSRVAYGIEITADRLARVGRAEVSLRSALADAGIVTEQLRIRDLGSHAVVEVDQAVAADVAARPDLLASVAAEFAAVEVDPRGFRSGSMNERLPDPSRYR